MSIPKHMHVSEGPQRFDVFTGGGRRRRFTAAEKAAIVEESYADGTSVCGVARRHGLTSQQLFGWRRLARVGSSSTLPAERPLFVPVIVASEPDAPLRDEAPTGPKPHRRRRRSEGASIEVEIDGVVVRLGRDADAGVIAAVISALKAGS